MQALSWAADGKNLLVGAFPNYKGALLEMNQEGRMRVLLDNPLGWIGHPLTSPDGKHIAFNKAVTDTTVTLLEQF